MHDDGFDLPPLYTVLRERESKIMHIFDPNPSFPLSTIHIQRLTVYSREYHSNISVPYFADIMIYMVHTLGFRDAVFHVSKVFLPVLLSCTKH
jgi:hypothetical protein